LRESARVDFLRFKLRNLPSLYKSRLHSDLNEAVV
jgi:hypothetical protein